MFCFSVDVEARCIGAMMIVCYLLPDTRTKADHNKVIVLTQVNQLNLV